MATTERYTTVVELNSKQAKDELNELIKLEEELRKKRDQVNRRQDPKQYAELSKQIRQVSKEAKAYGKDVMQTINTINNLKSASEKEIKQAIRSLEKMQGLLPRNSDLYKGLAEQLTKARQELEKMAVQQDRNNIAINRYQQELNAVGKSQQQTLRERRLIEATMQNLSRANIRDLEASLSIMKEQLRTQERGSAEYSLTQRRIKQIKTELERVNAEQKTTASLGTRLSAVFNKWQGAFIMLTGTFSQARMTLDQTIQSFASMEEEMANVRKYTGMTDEQVRSLNEDFMRMDTRTPREKLNQLAGDAGRLGLQTQETVKDFVEGANMINVALGDDLGDEAVKNVGKLAMAFGEDDRLGLRGAMLATGSAVNELAQNSSAGAAYLIDYTARVAGFGKQLGLTQAQMMGYGAVMDENLLRDEMAATAFGNMLTKMQTDTDKFAQIAGMSVEKFTKLVAEDANEAVLQLSENLRRQDPTTMMKMLDDMGLDGSRAVSVLATLADKVDDVRARQELATKAYEEGTSVIKEYDTMNNTVQAQLDKAKDRFNDLRVELGERLMPIMVNGLHVTSSVIEILKVLMDFTSRYKTTLITLTSAIVAYTVVVNAHTIATKLQVFWNEKVITSFLALNKVVSSHPYLALATAIASVVAALVDLTKKTDAATVAARTLLDIERKASADAESESRRLSMLVKVARDKAETDKVRKKAIEEINSISPEYLGNLNLENINTQKADNAIKNYTRSILLNAKAKRLAAQIDEIEQKKQEKRRQLGEGSYSQWYDYWITQWNDAVRTVDRSMNAVNSFVYHGDFKGWGETSITEDNGYAFDVARVALNRYRDDVASLEEQQKALNVSLEQTTQELVKINTTANTPENNDVPPIYTPGPSGSGRSNSPSSDTEKELRERNEAIKAANDELLAMNMAQYAAGEIDYREFLEKQQQLQLAGIRKRMELYGEGSDEYKKLQLKEQQLLQRGTEEQQQMQLRDLENMHRDLIEQLNVDFEDASSSIYQNEAALNEALFREDYDYIEERMALYNKGSLEYMELVEEREELLQQHRRERELYYQEQLENLRETYLGQSSEKRMTLELNALDELYRQGLVKEEEYQQARLQIQARYAQDTSVAVESSGKATAAFKVAKANAGDANAQNAWTGDLANLQTQMAFLKKMYQNDELAHTEYLAAKAMAVEEFLQKTQEKYGTVFEQMGSLYNAANAYAKASSDYEVAMVAKKYDTEIEKAGNNQKKVKKLEEQKQKETAAIKKKANERAMKVEMAQALASTAMGAINAYTSAAKVPLVGYLLAPVAAAAALAAGMLQIATIKKQHQAEATGYYEGGYTGGRNYRRTAGVVHEGEFVANHQAVNNPHIAPMLDFIDAAQRNNTIGSLTMEDVRRSVGTTNGSPVITPVVNIQTDNSDLKEELQQLHDVNDALYEAVRNGIPSYLDPEQAKKAIDHIDNLKSKK